MNLVKFVRDGWENTISGLGRAMNTIGLMSYQQPQSAGPGIFQALYENDWMARKIVDSYPREALRKKPSLKGRSDSDEILRQFAALNTHPLWPQGALLQAICMGRLAPGAAIILGSRDVQQLAPLRYESADLAWLDVAEFYSCAVQQYNTDANSMRYGMPEVYRVTTLNRRTVVLHESRVILCEGLPRALPDKAQPWISVLQPVYEQLQRYGLSWAAVTKLIEEASIGVFGLAGLYNAFSSKDKAILDTRLEQISQSKSVARTLFIDPQMQESFTRTSVTWNGLSDVMQQIVLQMASAADMPATELVGQAPAGMNATGEYDRRSYLDKASLYREQHVEAKLVKILSCLARTEVELEWPSLWEESPSQAADTRLKTAQADNLWFQMSAIDGTDIARSRTNDGTLGVTVDPEEKARQAAAEAERVKQAITEAAKVPNAGAEQTPAAGTPPAGEIPARGA